MPSRVIAPATLLLALTACSSTSTNPGVGSGGATTGGAGGTAGGGSGGAAGSGGGSGGADAGGGAGGGGGSGAEGPSCKALLPCNTTESCCANVLLSGGEFQRDNVNGAEHKAKISSFRLDMFEVTVGRFRNFVDAGAPAPASGSGKHTHVPGGIGGWVDAWNAGLPLAGQWDGKFAECGADKANPQPTWTAKPDAREKHPLNCVSFPQAYAFCIWDGGFLPTEAELNFAQVNGTAQTTYPWGNQAPTPALAVFGQPAGGLLPVGSTKASNLGLFDLAGSLYEFTRDSHSPLGGGYPKAPCEDCANVADPAGAYVIRGGGWLNTAATLEVGGSANRLPFFAAGNNVGFRCARSP